MQYLKRKLITYLAKNLLPAVEPRDIIAFSKDKAFINKKEISGEELSRLKIEADYWQSTRLYSLINSYFAELVQKKMFIEGTDVTDILFGKTCLYTLSVQDTICNNLKNAKVEPKKN